MTEQRPITPPPELKRKLYAMPQMMAIELAFKAGADQELEACCEWVETDLYSGYGLPYEQLRAARRPKPLNLKEQALEALDEALFMADDDPPEGICSDQADIIRRALEQLNANLFVLPCVKSSTYLRGEEVKNKAINLSLCIAIEKKRFKWYPDNQGKPCISFHFEQGREESWVYDREEDRDRDFDRIIYK